MSRISILINRNAGSGKGKKIAKTIKNDASLQESIFCVTESLTPEIAKNSSTIVICGGDGTVHHAINKLLKLGYDKSIAIFPIGTGNDLARQIKSKEKNILKFLKKIIKEPSCQKLDVFSINKKILFTNYISFGLDGFVLSKYDALAIPRLPFCKKIAFALTSIYALLFYRKKIRLESKDFTSIIISNTKYYAGGSVLAVNSKLDDERIEILKLKRKRDLIRAATNRPPFVKYLDSLTINTPIKFKFEKSAPIQIDGENYSKYFANCKEFSIEHKHTISVFC